MSDVFDTISGVAEFNNVTPQMFAETIVPRHQPAVMRGLIGDWHAVKLAGQSADAVADYLKTCDIGRPAQTLLGDPTIQGEFFYGDELNRFNFQRGNVAIPVALDRLLAQRSEAKPYAVYIQSAPIEDFLPRFLDSHHLDILPPDILPRIWIGNQLRVQTHYDLYDNIACVVAGKRRFTLFPPEQLVNLYPGPLDRTIAGPPVSMVRLEDPDFDRYPRFREALEHAQTAELEAGDAVYIPYFWWHHVRSLETFNVLVNYWWNGSPAAYGQPALALFHALLSMRDMPPERRQAWKAMFDYFVFNTHGEPLAHLKPEDRGPLGPLRVDQMKKMQAGLIKSLRDQWPDEA